MKNHNSKLKTPLKDWAYNYAIKIIEFMDTLPKDNSTNVIVNQLLRSATSIGANVIEAQASSSKRDFANFFNHSLKSANADMLCIFNIISIDDALRMQVKNASG